MRVEIQREREQGAQMYFDVTGGESLILGAFGMLSKEFETPMHLFDVSSDKFIELNEDTKVSISKGLEAHRWNGILNDILR